MKHNKKATVTKSPTPANRSMNKAVYCLKNPTPANRSMNPAAKVTPSK